MNVARRTTPPGRSLTVAALTETRASRDGATLTEVLISLLAMGIGVVAIATMFPISVLKAVKATQLTHAAILRYNADALIDSNAAIYNAVHDPPRLSVNGMGNALAGTGRDDSTYPDPFRDPGVVEHSNQRYVVDPLGAVNHSLDGTTRLVGMFGHDGTTGYGAETSNVTGAPPGFVVSIGRFRAGATSLQQAEQLAMLPDDWTTLVDAKPPTATLAVASGTLTFASSVDLSVVTTLAGGNNPASRVVLFGALPGGGVLETKNLVREIASRSGQALTLTPGLPTGYQMERVRIEQQDQQYTWMLTVRKDGSGASASVDVVVFFRRTFDAREEQIYDARWSNPVVAGGQNTGNVSGGPEVVLSGFTAADKPAHKKGGFVFDPARAEWYRIQNVTNETATSVTLSVERRVPPIYDTLASRIAAPGHNGYAMVLKSVVDVYHLPPKGIE